MIKKIYLVLGLGMIMFYSAASFLGWELGTPGRENLPAEARGPNGYRSFHFWHYGFRGGK